MANQKSARYENLIQHVKNDIAKGDYYGLVLKVTRGDDVVFHEVIGAEDAKQTQPLKLDSVFSIFSMTKAFTNVLALSAVEHGRLALTTRVSDIIPEFSGAPRDKITLFHLLTHMSGLPSVWTPKAGMYEDQLDELVEAVVANVHGVNNPGERCHYSPICNHVLMGEMIRRTDPLGRGFRDIMHQDLFEPLGMSDTALGVSSHMRTRKVVPDLRGVVPIEVKGRTMPGPHSLFEEPVNDAPHHGASSTVNDISRFATMLRQGGELDGSRILSPRILEMARQNWTGDKVNELYRGVALKFGWDVPPAYYGLGFGVRGDGIIHHQLGTMTSPETFGNHGAGSTLFWVDPKLDMTFSCLSAGIMTQGDNIERFQRISDIVVSMVD